MTTQELRIGNYVSYNGGIIIINTIYYGCVNIDIVDSDGIELEDLQPIPLTEDILLKCHFGFKNKGFDDLSVSYEVVSKKICICIGNYYKHIDYLHQLQNIIFDLTGEELKINL